jgi:hypothetical protein
MMVTIIGVTNQTQRGLDNQSPRQIRDSKMGDSLLPKNPPSLLFNIPSIRLDAWCDELC